MSLKGVSDHILLEKCRQDDKLAFETLFERYFRRLYNFTLHYLKDSETAEELVMDLMLNLWKNRHDLKLKGELLSYLFSAMRNVVISHVRRKAIQTTPLEFAAEKHIALARAADYDLCSIEAEDIYQQKLKKLSPQRRRVFELSRFENKTYLEIASQLDLSLSTVKKHMNASLQHFRDHLDKYMDTSLTLFILFLPFQ